MTPNAFRDMAASFPGVIEAPHFDRAAFKVEKKRIFATLHAKSRSANLKLPLADQSTFCTFGKGAVYPVPNKWGLQGWTTFELDKTTHELMLDALNVAYEHVFQTKQRGK